MNINILATPFFCCIGVKTQKELQQMPQSLKRKQQIANHKTTIVILNLSLHKI